MTHPPGSPPSDPGGGDGTTGPGRKFDAANPRPDPTNPGAPQPAPPPPYPPRLPVAA